MGAYGGAAALVGKLEAELPPDAIATADARSVAPPCVLVAHTAATYDAMCSASVSWEVVALAPGPFNADAWQSLDVLAAAVRRALPVEGYRVVAYRLALDSPPLPAYLFTFTGGVDLD
jgi:hypothetical protein